MTGAALIRPLTAVAWELRTAWATGRRVSLTLERADHERLEGHVSRVAATDAHVTVAGLLVPLNRVLAVHLPSRLGDSTVAAGDRWRGRARALPTVPGQMELELPLPCPYPLEGEAMSTATEPREVIYCDGCSSWTDREVTRDELLTAWSWVKGDDDMGEPGFEPLYCPDCA